VSTGTTTSDFEWPFHASRAISAVAEHVVYYMSKAYITVVRNQLFLNNRGKPEPIGRNFTRRHLTAATLYLYKQVRFVVYLNVIMLVTVHHFDAIFKSQNAPNSIP